MEEAAIDKIMTYVARNMDTIPYKTLRHDEVELSTEEKLANMRLTLNNDPGLFLSKWGKHLSQNTLKVFETLKEDYEVNFYLNSLLYNYADNNDNMEGEAEAEQRHPRRSAMQILAHNRRYEYLQRHLRNSDYFSEEAIQLREPVLYDEYIGQYVPDREKYKPFDKDMTLVGRIYSNMDRKYVDDEVQKQKAILEEQFEEEEEEEDEDEGSEGLKNGDYSTKKSMPGEASELPKSFASDVHDAVMSDATGVVKEGLDEEDEMENLEKEMEEMMLFREEKRQELIRLLEERFLAGKDEDFSYDQVDFNEDYDDLRQQEEDILDRYFEDGDN